MPQHPTPFGIISLAPFTFDDKQRRALQEITLIDGCGDTEWQSFVDALEWAIRYFVGYKKAATASSSASVRANLEQVVERASRLGKALAGLDSFSRELVQTRAPNLFEEAAEHQEALLSALAYAQEALPSRGRRVETEKDHLAALVLEAVRRHTAAKPTQIKGGFLEQVLAFTLECAGEKPEDLHTLVERVSQNKFVEDHPGVTILNDRKSAIRKPNS